MQSILWRGRISAAGATIATAMRRVQLPLQNHLQRSSNAAILLRVRKLSEAVTTPSTRSTPLRVVSRRAVQKQKETSGKSGASTTSNSQSNSKPIEELPWPRNIVLATYAVTAVAVPYTLAWIFSTNATVRSFILNDADDDDIASWSRHIMERLRHHYGVRDWEALSEPEAVDVTYPRHSSQTRTMSLPFRFVDEPTARIRRQQAHVASLEADDVLVRFHSPLVNESFEPLLVTLPARTVARHDAMIQAVQTQLPATGASQTLGPLVAVDFPITNDTAVGSNNLSMEEPVWMESVSRETAKVDSPSMSIYSLWHYHVVAAAASTQPRTSMTDTEWNLSRVHHQIEILQAELGQATSVTRPIDDIQAELRKLQAEKRRYQWKQWTMRS